MFRESYASTVEEGAPSNARREQGPTEGVRPRLPEYLDETFVGMGSAQILDVVFIKIAQGKV